MLVSIFPSLIRDSYVRTLVHSFPSFGPFFRFSNSVLSFQRLIVNNQGQMRRPFKMWRMEGFATTQSRRDPALFTFALHHIGSVNRRLTLCRGSVLR